MIYGAVKYAFHAIPAPYQAYIRERFFWWRRDRSDLGYRNLRRVVDKDGYTLMSADRLKCIFVHIPKCAGVSLARSLFGNLGGGHLRIQDYQSIYSPLEFSSFFKFTFVRNPWDRLASAFFFLKSGGMNEYDKQFADIYLSNYDTFDQFVTEWVNPDNIKLYYHFQPQCYFLKPREGSSGIDFLGYLENIAEDFLYVRDRLGINAELPYLNKTKDRLDYREVYNNKTASIISDVYAEDIKYLGYTFDNSNLNQIINARDAQLKWHRHWLFVGSGI